MPDLTDGAVRLSDEAIAEMMSEIYRETWDKSSLTESLVTKETRNIFREAVNKGVPRSTPRRAVFRERLSKSTDVFSVFRVHTQAQHMAELLVDEEGRRRSFAEWAEEVQPYVNHQNRVWLRTEYDTAMRRAESEADWVRFQEDADLYPCLEWVPTTSANPGADHRPFWGTVLPIDDEFWTEHRPGDRWNCKCSLRQTDKTPTRTPSVEGERYAPSRGLKSKPGSGEIFSDDHLYFPEDCHICPFGGGLHGLWADLTGRKRGNCVACKRVQACHEASQYTIDNTYGERLKISVQADQTEVEENTRAAHSLLSSFPKMNMQIRKHVYEAGVKNPEYLINDNIADRKGIESPNGVASGFNKAIKQGCSVVVLDLDMHPDKFKQLPSIKLASAINNRHFDFENGIISECYIIYNGKAVKITTDFFSGDKRQTKERIRTELEKIKGNRSHL